MAALLIKNGRVIDPASGHDAVADVLIEDGVIVPASEANLDAKHGAEVFDATGLIVAPGFIDMYVHRVSSGFGARGDHSSNPVRRAAAAGGFIALSRRCRTRLPR